MPSDADLLRQLDDLLVRYARERLARILDGQAPPIPKLQKLPATRRKPARAGRRRPGAKKKAGKRTASRTNELKRIAATKPVSCPVEGCRLPGVRRFQNFCAQHNRKLGGAEKNRLRAAQVAGRP